MVFGTLLDVSHACRIQCLQVGWPYCLESRGRHTPFTFGLLSCCWVRLHQKVVQTMQALFVYGLVTHAGWWCMRAAYLLLYGGRGRGEVLADPKGLQGAAGTFTIPGRSSTFSITYCFTP